VMQAKDRDRAAVAKTSGRQRRQQRRLLVFCDVLVSAQQLTLQQIRTKQINRSVQCRGCSRQRAAGWQRQCVSACPTFVLEDVEADAADAVDVGMIDLAEEVNLRRHHRIVLRQEQLETEHAT
jgi:Fe-S-cluster-containing dehydrogenase component